MYILNKVNFIEYKQQLRNASETNTELHERVHSLTNTNDILQKRIDRLEGIIKEQNKLIKKQSGKLVLSFKYV